MAKIRWTKIKTEYITGTVSQRELAKKHGVSYSLLSDKSRAEGWVALRREHQGKTVAKAAEKISDRKADQMAQELTAAAGELLDMVRKGIRNLDRPVREHKETIEQEGITTSTEWITLDQPDGYVDLRGAKAAGNALRDVYTVLGLKTELERQEQEARIAALRAKAAAQEGDQDDGEIRLVMANNMEDFAG